MVSSVTTASTAPQSKQPLTGQQLSSLNAQSNRLGLLQLASHLSVMGVSGYLWFTADGWLKIAALIVYGFSLAILFAPLHECSHRTAFANNRLNNAVAWLAGVLSFYNSAFYRRFHKWHHRYTQVPGKDPELGELRPSNIWEYLLVISGVLWWRDKFKGHYRIAVGNLENCPYIPEAARDEVVKSTRLQLALYLGVIIVSTALGHPGFIVYAWLLPLAVGQPFLRYILMAEHTGCTTDNNYFTNTRTTLSLLPLRLMVWNIPFHAEHHLYPSIPFHKLPQAHQQLSTHFRHVDSGYLKVHRDIAAGWK
ncbi:MAG: fatty acid desaturase [Cyanophyceae cyanobacterium]